MHGVESNNQLVIEWISELVSQSVSQVVNALLCVRKLFLVSQLAINWTVSHGIESKLYIMNNQSIK